MPFVTRRWLLLVGIFWLQHGLVQPITRTYYFGIVEQNWDYAPSGKNLITGQTVTEEEHASVFLAKENNTIGRVYKKAVYKQFTGADYVTEVPKPSWLGFLGPVLKAEVGDTIVVHLKNFASRPYSLHPHGVFYEKDSEGALYPDGTSGKNKKDDFVPPGGNHTYVWIVNKQHEPSPEDPSCLTWIYHSHIDAPKDISSGLIGSLLTCRKGILDRSTLSRTDVEKDFILMFTVVDENHSWYLDDNMKINNLESVDKDDDEFKESNKMHAINGYLYGNLPGLDMCVGERVSWHLFGMGNEVDIHSAYFLGHTFTNRGHRADVVNLFPATFVTAEMTTWNIGTWMLSCQVNDHIQAGMQALYNVQSCNNSLTSPPLTGVVRKYFIAAEKVPWNYGPLGIDKFSGNALNATGSDSETFFTKEGSRIGGSYLKVQYTEYTDDTFTQKKNRSEAEKHLGILGPVIKAEVGDTVLVTFSNKADRNYSIVPHGVAYSKSSEGAEYEDGFHKMGSRVKPGLTFQYNWTVPENAGPTASDSACLTYLYYSAVDPVMDTNSGLVGPLIVCKKNTLNADGTQTGINKELYLLFTVFDENLSWYLDTSIQRFSKDPSNADKEDEDFQESNKMHAVNGYMFGNLPGLEMCRNDNVSWHLIGLGTEVDIHGIYFEGNTIHMGGMTRDTLNLFPHSSVTAYMQPDQVGSFQVVCRTTDHFTGGMKHMYDVKSCNNTSAPKYEYRAMRTYFIAAEEVHWDYSPDRRWELENHNTTEHESYGHVFINGDEEHIGSRYKKVIYREYTNGDFTTSKTRSTDEEHLGILGPIIRAEVGESILIVFKNKAKQPYSIHAHGVEDERKQNEVPVTQPGEVNLYRWNVPERSGPGHDDPNCITWVYYSTVHFVKDTNSGLVGPLITCRKGILNSDGIRKDVDREFALLFLVFDENESWYLSDNIKNYLNKNPEDFKEPEDFGESNKIHAINGKIYGNLHGLTMIEGEKTNWYLIGLGNEIDMHTVHFHAQSFLFKTDKEHRADVYDLFPGTFQTIELIAGNPGTWLLHCHVADHIHAGMETTFTIKTKSESLNNGLEEDDTVSKVTNQEGIELFGSTLDAEQAKTALVALLIIGITLLAILLTVLAVLSVLRKRMFRWSYHNPDLSMHTL